MTTATLTGTIWTLTRLGENAVIVPSRSGGQPHAGG